MREVEQKLYCGGVALSILAEEWMECWYSCGAFTGVLLTRRGGGMLRGVVGYGLKKSRGLAGFAHVLVCSRASECGPCSTEHCPPAKPLLALCIS